MSTEPTQLHIFPKALLRDDYNLRVDSLTVDQVANLAFLSQRANARISNAAPSIYLAEIEPQRLKAQCVPLDRGVWQLNRFEDFVLRRRAMLADAINHLLQSLTSAPSLVPISTVEILNSRVDVAERWMREVIAKRLYEAYGDSAWDQCIPKQLQSKLLDLIDRQVAKSPFEADHYNSLASKLGFALFSDYPKIIKANYPLFSDLFGNEVSFDTHVRTVTEARNAIKHNRELSSSELASAEAGLRWLEDCRRHEELGDAELGQETTSAMLSHEEASEADEQTDVEMRSAETGDSIPAQQNRSLQVTATRPPKGKWDEPSFFAALSGMTNESKARTVKSIADWARSRNLDFWFGSGKTASFGPVLRRNGNTHYFFYIWSDGQMWINLREMSGRAPFSDLAKRQALLARLNNIQGVRIPESSISGQPPIALSALTDPIALSQFLATFDWYIGMIRDIE